MPLACKIMGVLNVTPDSFSDGGHYFSAQNAVKKFYNLLEEGADYIDIGAESSRPGAEYVSEEEEWQRLLPILKEIKNEKVKISIDSRRKEIIKKACDYGIKMWNDISAGDHSNDAFDLVAEYDLELVLMHKKGDPNNMQNMPNYDDVVEEIYEYLLKKTEIAFAKGVKKEKIFVDPGIGFGKNLSHNIEILRNISKFSDIGHVLIGTSRKSFLGLLAEKNNIIDKYPKERIGGSISSAIFAFANGAKILRVHDVYQTKFAIAIYKELSYLM